MNANELTSMPTSLALMPAGVEADTSWPGSVHMRHFLVASFLFAWPDLRAGSRPRGLRFALAFPVLGLAQIVTRQTVAPWFTVEAMMVGFAMAMVWAVVDARTGTSSTDSGRRLTWGLLAVCASESTFAAVQWSTDKRSLFGEQSELQTMPFGSYVNHNNFAGLVSLGVPLALAMAIVVLLVKRRGSLDLGAHQELKG